MLKEILRRKMTEVRNLYLHKEEKNIRERINEGKIKYFLSPN